MGSLTMSASERHQLMAEASRRLRRDDTNGALAILDQLAEAFPFHEGVASSRAYCLGRLGRYDEAWATFQKLGKTPTDPRAAKLRDLLEARARAAADGTVSPETRDRAQKLKQRLDSLRTDLDSEYERFKSRESESMRHIETLNESLTRREQALKSSHRQNREFATNLDQLNRKLAEIKDRTETPATDVSVWNLMDLEAQVKRFKQRVTEQEEALRYRAAERDELERLVNRLQVENDRLRNAAETSALQSPPVAPAQDAAQLEQVQKLTDEAESLRADLAGVRAELNTARRQLEEADADLEHFRKEADTLRLIADEARASLSNRRADDTAEADALRATLATQEAELAERAERISRLEKESERHQREAPEAQTNLLALQERNDALQAELDHLSSVHTDQEREWDAQRSAVLDEASRLTAERDELRQDLAARENALRELEARFGENERRAAEADAAFQAQLEGARAEIASFQAKLAASDAEISELQQQLEAAHAEAEAAQLKSEEHYRALQQSFDELQLRFGETSAARAVAEEAAERLRADLANVKDQLADALIDVERAGDARNEAQEHASAARAELAQHTGEIESLQHGLREADDREVELRHEIQVLQQHYESSSAQAAELLEERDGLLEVRAELEQALVDLQTKFDESREAAESRITMLNSELAGLREAQEIQAANRLETEAQLTELRSRAEVLEAAAETAAGQAQQLAEDKARLEIELAQMAQAAEMQQQEALQLREEVGAKQAALDEIEATYDQLHESRTGLEERAAQAEAERAEANARAEAAEQAREALEAELTESRASVTDLNDRFHHQTGESAALRKEISVLETALAERNGDLEAMAETRRELQQRMDALQKQLSDVERARADQLVTRKELEEAHRAATERRDLLEARVAELESRLADLREAQRTHAAEMKALQEEKGLLARNLAEVQNRCNQLEIQEQQLGVALEKERAHIAVLRDERDAKAEQARLAAAETDRLRDAMRRIDAEITELKTRELPKALEQKVRAFRETQELRNEIELLRSQLW